MRPYIICHMGTSIDGRLHPSRFTSAAAGISRDVLRGHYERIHESFEADGWIVGRKTMSEMAIGIDPSGRFHYGKDNVGGDHAVAVLGEQVSDSHLAELRMDGASYVFAGPRGDDLAGAMERIGSMFDVKKLLPSSTG